MSDETQTVTLTLSQDEALVVLELLSRFSNDDGRIEDQAEAGVLCDLCCMLESQLVQPFRENYVELLERAREAVRDPRQEQAG